MEKNHRKKNKSLGGSRPGWIFFSCGHITGHAVTPSRHAVNHILARHHCVLWWPLDDLKVTVQYWKSLRDLTETMRWSRDDLEMIQQWSSGDQAVIKWWSIGHLRNERGGKVSETPQIPQGCSTVTVRSKQGARGDLLPNMKQSSGSHQVVTLPQISCSHPRTFRKIKPQPCSVPVFFKWPLLNKQT